MITQVQYLDRSRVSSSSSLSSSSLSSQQQHLDQVREQQLKINHPNTYLKQIQEEQETYNQISELEDTCFNILNELKKLRIEEASLRDRNEINKVDMNGKFQTFQKLEELEVERLKDIFKRETEQLDNYTDLFEGQITQEAHKYANLESQIQSTFDRISKLNEDIGNI